MSKLQTSTTLFFALAFSLLSRAADRCEVKKLSFEPYSSSYLKRSEGPLTQPTPIMRIPEGLTEVQKDNWNKMSIMEKLDTLNKTRGIDSNYQVRTEGTHHTPNAPGWWGYCDRWSAASLDPEVNAIIDNADSKTMCGSIVISKGEIKEIFTGFYKTGNFGWSGHRIDRELSDPERELLKTGQDVFSAGSFDQTLNSTIGNKDKPHGVVLNVTKAAAVWNQPVFKMVRCESVATGANGMLPMDVLQSSTKEVNEWMLDVLKVDKETLRKGYGQSEPDFRPESKSLVLQLTKLQVQLINQLAPAGVLSAIKEALDGMPADLSDYSRVRSRLRRVTDALFNSGAMTLKDGFSVTRVQNTVHYGLETKYAADAKLDTSKIYEYYIVKNKAGEVVGSSWGTAPDERPGFAWVPSSHPQMRNSDEIQDLLEILNLCKNDPTFNSNNVAAIEAIPAASP